MFQPAKTIKHFVTWYRNTVSSKNYETRPDPHPLAAHLPGQAGRATAGRDARVVSTIENSLREKNEDYRLSKRHANLSFAFGAIAVLLGLATLIGGIWLFYLGKTQNLTMTMLSSIVSALLHFAGGVGFFLYKNSMRQLNEFHEELIQLQYLMLAIQLSRQLESSSAQNASLRRVIAWILKNLKAKRRERPPL